MYIINMLDLVNNCVVKIRLAMTFKIMMNSSSDVEHLNSKLRLDYIFSFPCQRPGAMHSYEDNHQGH